MSDTNDVYVNQLVINELSKEKYLELSAAGQLQSNQIYLVDEDNLDAASGVISNVGTPVSPTDAANKQYVDDSIPDNIVINNAGNDTTNLAIGTNTTSYGSSSNSILIGNSVSGSGIAIGYDTSANIFSIAMGCHAKATRSESIAVGTGAQATGHSSIATGTGVQATGSESIATGYYAKAVSDYTIAIGAYCRAALGDVSATADIPIVIGGNAANVSAAQIRVTKEGVMTVGGNPVAMQDDIPDNIVINNAGNNTNRLAIGKNTTSSGSNSILIGNSTKGEGIAIGYDTSANMFSIAMGCHAQATRSESIATGYSAKATGSSSIAIGTGAKATGYESIATGYCANAAGDRSIATGTLAQAEGYASIAIGCHAEAKSESSIATGHYAKTEGCASIAIGCSAQATNTEAIAIGCNAQAKGFASIATGRCAQAIGDGSIATGYCAQATTNSSIATGCHAQATGYASIATGYHAQATGSKSIATGSYACAKDDYTIAIGASKSSSYSVSASAAVPIVIGSDHSSVSGAQIRVTKEGVMTVGGKEVGASLFETKTFTTDSQTGETDLMVIAKQENGVQPRLHAGDKDIHGVTGFSNESTNYTGQRYLLDWDLAMSNDTSYLMGATKWTGSRRIGANNDAYTTTFVQPLIPTNTGTTNSVLPYALPCFENSPVYWNGHIIWNNSLCTSTGKYNAQAKDITIPWHNVGSNVSSIEFVVNNNKTDPANGRHSLAIGYYADAHCCRSVAVGELAGAKGYSSIATGYDAQAIGSYSIATGYFAEATSNESIATGPYAKAIGSYSIATGTGVSATGSYSIATGYTAQASEYSMATGYCAQATGWGSIATGYNTQATGRGSIAIGCHAQATNYNSIATGHGTQATGCRSIATGYYAKAKGDYTIAIGASKDNNYSVSASTAVPIVIGSDAEAVSAAQIKVTNSGIMTVGENPLARKQFAYDIKQSNNTSEITRMVKQHGDIWLAATKTGVYKSTDKAKSWTVTSRTAPTSSIFHVANDTWLAGGFSSDEGNGIHITHDNCATWTTINTTYCPWSFCRGKLVIDNIEYPNAIVASCTQRKGMIYSLDNGETWVGGTGWTDIDTGAFDVQYIEDGFVRNNTTYHWIMGGGYVAGKKGGIWYLDEATFTWIQEPIMATDETNPKLLPCQHKVYAVAVYTTKTGKKRIYWNDCGELAGTGGIYYIDEDDTTCNKISGLTAYVYSFVENPVNGYLYIIAFGGGELLQISDDGNSFVKLATPTVSGVHGYAFDISEDCTYFVMGYDGQGFARAKCPDVVVTSTAVAKYIEEKTQQLITVRNWN